MEMKDYYKQISAILKECEKETINLIKTNGGEIELPVNDDENFSLVLPYYCSNGDTLDTIITKVKVYTSESTGDWLEVETKDNEVCQLGAFADTPIIYIYEYIWRLLHQ